jgi:hypothetical protein
MKTQDVQETYMKESKGKRFQNSVLFMRRSIF